MARSIEHIGTRLARLQPWLFGVNVLLTAYLAASFVTGSPLLWMPQQETMAERTLVRDFIPSESISDVEVTRIIRGHAPLRTNRVREVEKVDELANYQLIGVSVRTDAPKAYVKDTKRKGLQTSIVEVGMRLGSYEIVEITREGVKLRKGDEIKLLRNK